MLSASLNKTFPSSISFKLKGVPTDQVKDEVESIVVDIGLNSKRFDRAANLSGGQKRKLGVGIALIGGSKVSCKMTDHRSTVAM